MDVLYFSKPEFKEPIMIAAWPGMGYLSKISADFLRRRLHAKIFAEIKYFQNAIAYRNGLAELPTVKHKFYAVPGREIIICVGDAQPPIPGEAMKLANIVLDVAKELNVKRIYTMAAYPSDYQEEPQVYGLCTNGKLKEELASQGIRLIEGEGEVNGLNGIIIGLAKMTGIEGICLLGEIRYTNVPQHLSSKAVIKKLSALLDLDVDTSQLEKRAKKIDASIRKSFNEYQEVSEDQVKPEKKFRYIS
jgi:proteasome assembly chaperone (PAC2) family protein